MIPWTAILILLCVICAPVASAQTSCLDPDELVRLDGRWEEALRTSNVDFLTTLLADDFVWIHDHRSLVDTRASVLQRSSDRTAGAEGAARSRVSSDVEARVLGSTGVVTGFTVVDRGPEPTRYSFIRTYVETDGRCVLLANQTMAIPTD